MLRRTVAAAVLAAGIAAPAAGQAPAEFATLLRLVPDTERSWSAWTTFAYFDLRAIEEAAELAPADFELAPMSGGTATDLYEDWPDERRVAWDNNIQRLAMGPTGLVTIANRLGEGPSTMVETVGVDFFAIDRVLTFWERPDVMLLAGDAPMTTPEDLHWSALYPRGYALETRDGITVLHRFQDDTRALQLTDALMDADPFGHGLEAVRVAVLPDLLVATRNWADLDTVLARHAAPEPTDLSRLAEAMITAAFALDGVEPRVLQAWAHPLRDLTVVPDPVVLLQPDGTVADAGAVDRLLGGQPEGPSLPVFPIALFLDLQAGGEQVNAIALPFPNREDADAAAEVVAARLADWAPEGAPEPLAALLGGRVESLVVDAPALAQPVMRSFYRQFEAGGVLPADLEAAVAEASDAAGAVAVIALRYPMPADLSQPADLVAGSGGPGSLGRGLKAWIGAIVNRQFTPLAAP